MIKRIAAWFGLVAACVFLASFPAAFLASAQTQNQQAAKDAGKAATQPRVSGTVQSSKGEPLPGVEIVLRTNLQLGTGARGPLGRSVLRTTSDVLGRFTFEGLGIGGYDLTAEKAGWYLAKGSNAMAAPVASPPTPMLRLEVAGDILDLIIKMVQSPSVSGRVADAHGDPVAGAKIRLLRYSYAREFGLLKEVGVKSTVNADSEGKFRFENVRPGRYYFWAEPPTGRATNAVFASRSPKYANRGGGVPSASTATAATNVSGDAEGFVATFYPQSLDVAGAQATNVQESDVWLGDLVMQKGKTYSISGSVEGSLADLRLKNPRVLLLPRNLAITGSLEQKSAAIDSKGDFLIQNVVPNDYVLRMVGDGTATSRASYQSEIVDPAETLGPARVAVSVRDSPVKGVVMHVAPLAGIVGRFVIEDEPKPPKAFPWPAFSLHQRSGLTLDVPGGGSQADGTFSVTGVEPLSYRLLMQAMPDGYYLKSALAYDRPASLENIALGPGEQLRLKLVLSPKAGRVGGVVSTKEGQAVPNSAVTIRNKATGESQTVAADAGGAYSFANLGPGAYELVAWETTPERGLETNLVYAGHFSHEVESITVQESSSIARDLRAVPVAGILQVGFEIP